MVDSLHVVSEIFAHSKAAEEVIGNRLETVSIWLTNPLYYNVESFLGCNL